MSDDQFTKLFKYMEKRFGEIDSKLDSTATKDDIEKLVIIIDGYAANLDTYAQEMAAMEHKLDRLEKYIQVLADKAGVDLDTIRY